jgi:hypothetical protein
LEQDQVLSGDAVKPGDTVIIRQPDSFVWLYTHPGSIHVNIAARTCANPVVLEMQHRDVGLVIAVTEVKEFGCTWRECLVLVATVDGHVRYGWRETDRFDIMTETGRLSGWGLNTSQASEDA